MERKMGTGTGVETCGRTQDGKVDGSGEENESRSGDGNGDENRNGDESRNGDGNKDEIGKGGGEGEEAQETAQKL